jgi:diadenosine tetraphosphate (Ap4A) HIT family hydrolase
MEKISKKRYINQKHIHAKEQSHVMKEIAKKGHCPFCTKNLLKYHPKPIIKNGKYWVMTENAWPYKGTRVHLIFILKKHKEHLKSLNNKEWSELLKLFKYSIKKCDIAGGSIFLRFGDTNMTGGSVNHLHAQLISGGKQTKNKKTISIPLGYRE